MNNTTQHLVFKLQSDYKVLEVAISAAGPIR